MMDKKTAAFDQITHLLQAGRDTDAVRVAESFISNSPDDYYGYYLLGLIHRTFNRFADAVKCYSKAAKISEEPYVLLGLGIAQQLNGQLDAAVASLKRGIALDPDIYEMYNSLGLTYKKQGQMAKAIACYEEALECLVRLASGEVKKQGIDHVTVDKATFFNPKVLDATSSVLRTSPAYSITSNNLGVCLAEMGRFEEAKEAYRDSIAFIPDDYDYPFPHLNLDELERLYPAPA